MKSLALVTIWCLSMAYARDLSLFCFRACWENRAPSMCNCNAYGILSQEQRDNFVSQNHHHHHQHHHQTQPPPSTPTPEPEPTVNLLRIKTTTVDPKQAPTTSDICDYLCSIQLGGDACFCSKPGLPGRK